MTMTNPPDPYLPFADAAGRAMVESDTTTMLRLGDAARMDAHGWLEITVPEQG